MNVLKYLESKGIKDNPRIIDANFQSTDYCLQDLLEDFKKQLLIPDIATRLNAGVKIFKQHKHCVGTILHQKSCLGTIVHKSDFGINYWIVEWDNGNWSCEYGLDLNVW
jgi:hypothetical protein